MLTNFVMSRNNPEVQKLAQKNFFEKIEVPDVVEITETVPQSIKRALGEDFYKLENNHIVEGIIQNECIFDMKFLKTNIKVLSFISQAISNIFQGYMGVIGNTVTQEAVNTTKATFNVASVKEGVVSIDLTLSDLGEIAEYVNGIPMTLKNYKAISKLGIDIQNGETALKNAPDQESAKKIQNNLIENYKTLNDYYVDLVTGFFNILKTKLGIENIEDIVDVTVVFKTTIASETGEQINGVSFVTLHSAYNILYRELEESMI